MGAGKVGSLVFRLPSMNSVLVPYAHDGRSNSVTCCARLKKKGEPGMRMETMR